MDEMKLPENMWSVLRHGTFTPSCCVDHKVACCKSKNISVSRWKFPVREDQSPDMKKRRFDPWMRMMRLHQKQKHDMKEFDNIMEELKVKGFHQQFTIALDPAAIGKISRLLDIEVPPSSQEKVDYESLIDAIPKLPDSNEDYYDESLMPSDMMSTDDQSSGSESPRRNPYFALLKRLRKKELEQKFPDQELMSVKNAEEELQQATVEFCQWSKTLGDAPEQENHSSEDVEEDSDANLTDKEGEAVFDVKSLRRMFYVAYGKPINCPHIPTVVREPDEGPPPLLLQTLKEEEEKKMHVAWYLPPKIWFKKWTEMSVSELPDYTMTTDEIALASSYTVKKYLEYLEKNNLEPPRGLVELMKKQKARLLEEDNENEKKKATGSAKS